jgi:hypothetical protein
MKCHQKMSFAKEEREIESIAFTCPVPLHIQAPFGTAEARTTVPSYDKVGYASS